MGFSVFLVLITVVCFLLIVVIMVQNPKGGGLAGNLGGLGNQLMGVKQTTDILEKGTWVFAAVLGLLCLISPAFIPKDGVGKGDDLLKNISTTPQQKATPAPANTTNLPGTSTAPADTNP